MTTSGAYMCGPWTANVVHHKTAIFRLINQRDPLHDHDALEFPDGQTVLLHFLKEGQQATVLSYRQQWMMPRSRNERPTCGRSVFTPFKSRLGHPVGTMSWG
jgi:hypothetical protein